MKKIKIIMSVVLICLIMLFACIPKVSAYSNYVTLDNTEIILFNTEHSVTMTEVIDIDRAFNFGNLTLEYTFRKSNDDYFLYLYRYEYFANGVWYNDFLDEYIDISSEVFDLIGVESSDRDYINDIKSVLDKNILYITITLEDFDGYIYPIINIHDTDFYYTEYELELQPFINQGDFVSYTYLYDFELEFVHTTMLYETYLYNRYRLDGNSLSQIEDISITDWLINSVGGLFDTPILGGISIGDILMFVLAIGLLFLFLRFFAGG